MKIDKVSADDIFLSSFLDDIVNDIQGFDMDPTGDPNLQSLSQQQHGDQNGGLLLSNDEVENWLMDDSDTLMPSGNNPSTLTSDAEKCDQIYHCSSTNLNLNDELDVLGWDCGDMNWDSSIQDQKVWDSEDDRLLSQLWESTNSDKGDHDGDKQNALVEWLFS